MSPPATGASKKPGLDRVKAVRREEIEELIEKVTDVIRNVVERVNGRESCSISEKR